MENLTFYQQSILDKLYGPLGKKEPLEELKRILKLYYNILKNEEDKFIKYEFNKVIENKIYFVLSSDFIFYQFDHYKVKYVEHLQDYLDDIPDSLEIDFISKCLLEQNSILDNSIKYYVEIDTNDLINVMEFVSRNFLDEYKNSSKRKIEFLEEKSKEYLSKSNELNPYPLIFISRCVYDNFIKYTSSHILDYYIDYSYLKKRLEDEKLIYKITDKEFMRFIFTDLNLISKKTMIYLILRRNLGL